MFCPWRNYSSHYLLSFIPLEKVLVHTDGSKLLAFQRGDDGNLAVVVSVRHREDDRLAEDGKHQAGVHVTALTLQSTK
ncbi:hypothetical protein PG990_009841 [Apiospora arundinis]